MVAWLFKFQNWPNWKWILWYVVILQFLFLFLFLLFDESDGTTETSAIVWTPKYEFILSNLWLIFFIDTFLFPCISKEFFV